jgi:hypothetical protein
MSSLFSLCTVTTEKRDNGIRSNVGSCVYCKTPLAIDSQARNRHQTSLITVAYILPLLLLFTSFIWSLISPEISSQSVLFHHGLTRFLVLLLLWDVVAAADIENVVDWILEHGVSTSHTGSASIDHVQVQSR